RKIRMPPARLFRRLKVAAPRHIAKKNSFRSAPRIVRGRESDLCTGLILRCCVTAFLSIPRSGKEPGHEVAGGDGHADTEENAREHALRAAFTEGKGEPRDDNRHEGKPASDRARKGLLQYVDRVFPWRVASSLRECRRGKNHAGQRG